MPNKQVKAQKYIIEISLSDNFAAENLYWFTVRVLPKNNEQEINSGIASSSIELTKSGYIWP
jgi:hypothetical protein